MGKKIGLALGSGGARGLAHVGVLQVLHENGYEISAIAGSSIGAFVGAWYAYTLDPKFIEEEIKKKKPKHLAEVMMDFSFGGGFVNGKKLEKFIETQFNQKSFSDLKIPTKVVATDIDSGESVVFSEGLISSAIRASMSVPLIFRPAEINGRRLVDGGLSRPVPVENVREMGVDIVIAVNLDGAFLMHPVTDKKLSLVSVSQQALNIVRHHLSGYETRRADIVLNPDTGITGIVGFKNFFDVDGTVEIGRRAMGEMLPKLDELLAS